MRNALTFDIEEYFQVEAVRGVVRPDEWFRYPSRVVQSTQSVLDLLDEHRVSATFFVVGWVAEWHPGLVRSIQMRGHELGCHGYAHRPIYAMSREEFREDLRRARRVIEDAAGVPVLAYRAPTCSVVRETLWALHVLAEEMFLYDSSIFPIHHDRYGIPDAPRFPHRIPLADGLEIVEFPMTTFRFAGHNFPFSGGGYLRLLPYSLIRRGLQRLNHSARMPAMVYLHPWEMDTEQPRLPLHGAARFRHYVNLHQTADKLDCLLRDFSFAPARQVLEEQGIMTVSA